MSIIIHYLATVLAVLLTIKLVPGVHAPDWTTVLLVAFVWSLIVAVIRPILRLLTLPITIVTFGLFSLVLNTLLFYAMTLIVPSFTVDGLWPAFLGAFVLSLVTWLLHWVI